MAETQSHPPDLSHRITALRTLQKEQEEHEQFLEAEETRQQIIVLGEEAKLEMERSLLEQQEDERGELELAHNREFEEFKNNWEVRLVTYRNTAGKLESELRAKHLHSLEVQIQEFAATLPIQPKPSMQLIAAKRMKEALVKAQNYKEAHVMVGRITEIEQKDAEAFVKNTQEKVEQVRRQIVQKQSLEYEALRHKHDISFKELLRQREYELDRLSKKFRNSAFELGNLQGMIKARSETRTPKLPIATKRVERILTAARSSNATPLGSPKQRPGSGNRCGSAKRARSPRRGDGNETFNA